MTSFSVPTIDLSPYVGAGDRCARTELAQALDRAACEVGFMQVVGHGVPQAAVDALAAAMDAFFALPSAHKCRYRAPPRINRGYSPPQSESLSLSLGLDRGAADAFEAFNIGSAASDHPGLALPADVYAENLWPEDAERFDAARFRGSVTAYFAEAGRVARCLTRVFADALGVDPGLIAAATDHSIDVLRLNHYPPCANAGPRPQGMGAHTDYGIVTVLWADPEPGLQVLGADGVWHEVLPAPGALLVNLGDLTARWTDDRWMSTLHRVRSTGRRRRSAAYFHDGNVDAVIATLPSCRRHGRSAYPPIRVGAHLAAKLAGSRGGQANAEAGREAQRARCAQDGPPEAF